MSVSRFFGIASQLGLSQKKKYNYTIELILDDSNDLARCGLSIHGELLMLLTPILMPLFCCFPNGHSRIQHATFTTFLVTMKSLRSLIVFG